MLPKLFNTNFSRKKILIAPLDWGLGHASRCVPIIRHLMDKNAEIWLAAEGGPAALLKHEFPQLPILPLPGYRVKYAKRGLLLQMLIQIPGILRKIREENRWLREILNKYEFEYVISDNRFGLSNPGAHCIFITHQLNIKTGLGMAGDRFLKNLNYNYIKRFNECWIPDHQGNENLTGELGHPKKLPATKTTYIGPVSRFKYRNDVTPESGHILALVSGPEPQRTVFENILIDQLVEYPGTATLVRGQPAAETILPSSNSIKIYNHLPAKDLQKEYELADWVIARSGYTTIMDLNEMKKKSILIPTPGQTEQHYLARYLMKKKFCYCVNQKDLDLSLVMTKAAKFFEKE